MWKIQSITFDKFLNSSENHFLKKAYTIQHHYFNDFVEMMELFENCLSRKQCRSILDKFLIGKDYFDLERYKQATSEINVLYYVLRNYNNSFVYEPKYNGGSNPECAFDYSGKRINIEVKCPDLTKWFEAEQRNTAKIEFGERIPQHKEVTSEIIRIVANGASGLGYDGVEELPRLDNKMKDYLISAQKKFPDSTDDNFNILVIALDIPKDMDRWYSYLLGDNGVLTKDSYVEEDYSNVDAVVLNNVVNGHTGWNKNDVDVWKLENYINLEFLSLDRERTPTGQFYFRNGWQIFGDLTYEFQNYLRELDKNEPDRDYITGKIEEMSIISQFVEQLKSKQTT